MNVRGPLTRSLLILAALLARGAAADEIRVAVATNFAEPMSALVAQFERDERSHGARELGLDGRPLRADQERRAVRGVLRRGRGAPTLLEQEGIAVRGSRFLYAVGRLALWSPRPGFRRRRRPRPRDRRFPLLRDRESRARALRRRGPRGAHGA